MSPTEPLSPADISSLNAEQGPIHVHVGGTAIFKGKPPEFEQLLSHIEQRLNLIPRFRQRVRHMPGQVGRPVWDDDADFDLRRHVRRHALPKPGGDAELRELVGWIMSEPLDQSRPLWQIHLIEGLEEAVRGRLEDPPRARRRDRGGRRRRRDPRCRPEGHRPRAALRAVEAEHGADRADAALADQRRPAASRARPLEGGHETGIGARRRDARGRQDGPWLSSSRGTASR